MWTLEPHGAYLKQAKVFQKRWPRELAAVLDNLDQYHMALGEGANPLRVSLGFIHPEGKGVIAIDERNHGKHQLKATRLYIYPDAGTRQIHVLTIGDKSSQRDDVKACHQFVESRKKNVLHDQEAADKRSGLGSPDFRQ